MDTIVGVEDVEEVGFINHVVTLLRNGRNLKNVSGIDCGNEFFTDPRYRPITPPFQLQRVLDTLFGTDPDRCFFTTRMWMLLRALTYTGLADKYMDIWPRVTYDLNGSSLFDAAYGINRITVFPDPGQETPRISVIGELQPDNGRGRLLQNWILRAYHDGGLWGGAYPNYWGGSVLVEVTNVLDNTKRTYPPETKAIPLHSEAFKDNPLTAYFEVDGLFVPMGMYTVNGLARPNEDLSDVYHRLLGMGYEILDYLFASSEPVNVGKDLFYKHKSVAFKVAGAVLALIYKLDTLKCKPQPRLLLSEPEPSSSSSEPEPSSSSSEPEPSSSSSEPEPSSSSAVPVCSLLETPGLEYLMDARRTDLIFLDGTKVDAWESDDNLPVYFEMVRIDDPGTVGFVSFEEDGIGGHPQITLPSAQTKLRGAPWFPFMAPQWTMAVVLDAHNEHTVGGVLFDTGPGGDFRVWTDPLDNTYAFSVGGVDFEIPTPTGPHVLLMRYDASGGTSGTLKVWTGGGAPAATQAVADIGGPQKILDIGKDFDVSSAYADISMCLMAWSSMAVDDMDDMLNCINEIWGVPVAPISL